MSALSRNSHVMMLKTGRVTMLIKPEFKFSIIQLPDRLCGLVVLGYRGLGSIPGATRFSEKALGIHRADHVAPSIRKSWH
jgi:hypothetical protein